MFTMLLSVFMYDHKLTPGQWAGAGVVFAGISVIALIVVGLVTYERTKYRRAFRQKKLAEQAAPIAYGT